MTDPRIQIQRGRDLKDVYESVLKPVFEDMQSDLVENLVEAKDIEEREVIYYKMDSMRELTHHIMKIIHTGSYEAKRLELTMEKNKNERR